MSSNTTVLDLSRKHALPVKSIIGFFEQRGKMVTENEILPEEFVRIFKKNIESLTARRQGDEEWFGVPYAPYIDEELITPELPDFVQALPRLSAAAKEFNIGQETLINFLARKGFDRSDLKPASRLTREMHELLLKEFEEPKTPVKARSDIVQFLESDHIIGRKHPAEILIEECLRTKAKELDLGMYGLTDEDFYPDSRISKLLSQCTHLEELIFSNIVFTETTQSYNQLTCIPQCVSLLINLKSLMIPGDTNTHGIKLAQIEWLDTLVKLEYLVLSNNQLKDMRGLGTLRELRTLNLSENLLTEISDLDECKKLEDLILANNRIKSIHGIATLTNLRNLILENNEIEDLKPLENLVNLEDLQLSGNQLRQISGLDNLSKLEELDLSGNQIEDIKGLEFLLDANSRLSLHITDNPFLYFYQLRLEKFENHLPFIKELLIRQMDGSEKISFSYPVKILMLGNHASGKSSLVDYLISRKTHGSTHILRIENYFLQGMTLRNVLPDAIFYDFGGQDFYHGLYQAFISRDALQVIVFNNSSDKNEITTDSLGIPIVNFDRRFWLGQKTYQEADAQRNDPYIMVQSFADVDLEEARQVNYNFYKGYKKGFFLALKNLENEDEIDKEIYEKGKEYFKAYLNGVIKRFRITGEEPVWYVHFLRFVFNKQNTSHAAVALTEVLEHYQISNVTEQERMVSLKTNLTTLHRHGLVMYYPHIPELQDIVWLNPQKLVEYIQQQILVRALADININAKPGIILKPEFENLIRDEKILLLLQEQKVIFLHNPTDNEKDEEYIIPNYLPLIDKRAADFQLFTFGIGHPNFIIKFNDFIPFGFINQMICFFGKEPDVKKFWRNQLLFTLSKQARVLIELDFEQLKVNIHFQVMKNTSAIEEKLKEYLFFSIMALYWNFKNHQILSFEEFLKNQSRQRPQEIINENEKQHIWRALQADPDYIPGDAYISLDNTRFVRCIELFQQAVSRYKIPSYGILNGRIDETDVKEIAVGNLEPFTHQKLMKMKKIFVSYSKHDEDYLQDFEDHLVTLREEGVATFNCRKIEFGKEWDYEVKKQIDDCDIMICLVSIKFLNTEYISKIEIPRAIEQNKIIVPIIIKACDWESSALGKFQAAQRGKIVSLDNNMKLLGQIRGQSAEEKAAFWTDIVKEFRAKLLLP